jgi:lipopolysaccharide export system permease protein
VSIIDRYLLQELYKTLLAILVVLSLVLSSLGFVQLLEKAATGALNPQVVLPLMGYEVLYYIARSIPPAFFLGVLMVLGRLYRDSEMTALAACGVGTGRIYRAFALSVLPVMPLTAWLALSIQPWAALEMETEIAAQKQDAAELVSLRPGSFNEFHQGELVLYAERIDKQHEEMHNIFIQNRQHHKLGLITADAGRHTYDPHTGDHYLTLHNGRRYEGNPGSAELTIAEFGTYTLRITRTPTEVRDARASRPTSQLYTSSDVQDRAEFWERVSYPVSLLTLMLVAVPLSRSLPRQGLYGRMLLAFLVYFAFLNLHAVSVSWMKKQVTPEWLGIWWVQAVLLALAGLALFLDSHWAKGLRRRLRRLRAAIPE